MSLIQDFEHKLYLEKLAKDCVYQMFIVSLLE